MKFGLYWAAPLFFPAARDDTLAPVAVVGFFGWVRQDSDTTYELEMLENKNNATVGSWYRRLPSP